jgi:hypothetical protein
MGQKFCTSCGAVLSDGVKFCENCGAAVEQGTPSISPSPGSQASAVPAASLPAEITKEKPTGRIIAGIVIVLVVLAGAVYFFVLPGLSGSNPRSIPEGGTGFPELTPVTTAAIVATPATIATTAAPTQPPDPFPDANSLRQLFSFNEGKYASRATVYRYWMNETYQWHNDMDNRYYTQHPKAGMKYLLVYVNIENLGSDGYPYPKSSTIVVHNGGNIYNVDTSHYLADKAGNREATPIEIQEIGQQSDFFRIENVEDYGYSHGTTQDFVYPGQGNAVDGYLIYEVPAFLTPENTYVEIVFDAQDRAVWKLG